MTYIRRWFKRLMKRAHFLSTVNDRSLEIQITELDSDFLDSTESDRLLDCIVALSNQELGSDYTSLSSVREMIREDDSSVRIALYRGNRIAGVAVGKVYSSLQECLDHVSPEDAHDAILDLVTENSADSNDPVGYVKTVVIASEFRKLGIAKMLVTDTLNWLAETNISRVLCIGWADDDGCHIESTMTSTGFESFGNFSNFYLEESLKLGYDCPSCGHPCNCSATVFFKSI